MNQTSSPRQIERPQSFCQYVPLQLSGGYGVALETSELAQEFSNSERKPDCDADLTPED